MMDLALVERERWYTQLVDDGRDIITEAVFTSRWALVEGYWYLGERVGTDVNYQEYAKGNKTSVQDLARNIGISERTLYYAIQFYGKYPQLDTVPEGKNISWNKIITKYLPRPHDEETLPPDPIEPKLDWGEVTVVGARLVTEATMGHLTLNTIVAVLDLCADAHLCEDCPDRDVCRQAFDKVTADDTELLT